MSERVRGNVDLTSSLYEDRLLYIRLQSTSYEGPIFPSLSGNVERKRKKDGPYIDTTDFPDTSKTLVVLLSMYNSSRLVLRPSQTKGSWY